MGLATYDCTGFQAGGKDAPAGIRVLSSNAKLNDASTREYGLGWYVKSYLGRTRIHHDRQYPGFRSIWEGFDDDTLTVIVLASAGRPRVDSLALNVAGFYTSTLAAPASPSAKPLAAPARAGIASTVSFDVRADKPAPKSVLEMEIWDSENKPVAKQKISAQDIPRANT